MQSKGFECTRVKRSRRISHGMNGSLVVACIIVLGNAAGQNQGRVVGRQLDSGTLSRTAGQLGALLSHNLDLGGSSKHIAVLTFFKLNKSG